MKRTKLPKGIFFADDASQENYRKALAGDVNEYGFKPIVVINSHLSGTGKTRLARHILETRYGTAAVSPLPSSEREWQTVISTSLGLGYLFLDHVIGTLKSQSLGAVVTAKEWSFRPLGTHKIEIVKPDIQVIVTGNDLSVNHDLMRRVIWIHLR